MAREPEFVDLRIESLVALLHTGTPEHSQLLRRVVRDTREQVAEGIGGLPSHKMHCSVLAADALKAAVEDYETRRVDISQ